MILCQVVVISIIIRQLRCVFQIIMPGYCVQGTVGHKILNGQRRIEFENKQVVSIFSICSLKQNKIEIKNIMDIHVFSLFPDTKVC